MTPPFLKNGFFRRNNPDQSTSPPWESTFSVVSDFSFPEVRFPSSSSFSESKPFHNYFPNPYPRSRPPRPFRRPNYAQRHRHFHPHLNYRFDKPEFYPLPYFGKWRGEHTIPHANLKLELPDSPPLEKLSHPSTPMPLLITRSINAVNESPGPSWMSFDDSKPLVKKKFRKKMLNVRSQQSGSSGIQMAIRHASPDCRLTEKQGKFIQSQLIEALDNTPKQSSRPRFLKSFYDQGAFWMVCADEKTRQWLIQNVKLLTDLWEDLDLVVEMVKLPKRPIVYVDLPELQKSVEVLDRLASQNEGLRIDSWVVLNRQVFKSRQRIIFSIDMDSFEFLKSKNFTVTWKLQTVTFRVPLKAIKSRAGKWIRGCTFIPESVISFIKFSKNPLAVSGETVSATDRRDSNKIAVVSGVPNYRQRLALMEHQVSVLGSDDGQTHWDPFDA